MIKQGLKNYLKSLRYFFTPLGTMFLGMMIGLSILFPVFSSACTQLIDGVKSLAESVNLDFGILFQHIWSDVQALDWGNPLKAFQTMLTTDWINSVITHAVNVVLGSDAKTFGDQVLLLVSEFTEQCLAGLRAFIACWILGFIGGYVLIKFLIRRNIAKRSMWKFVLSVFLNSVLSAGFTVLCVFVFLLWGESVYISLVLALLLVGTFALLQAYLLYGYKKIKFKKVVNARNVALYMLCNLIIFLISIAVTLIAIAVNRLMGLFVGLSFIAIAFIVIGLNAESYVLGLVEERGDVINDLLEAK